MLNRLPLRAARRAAILSRMRARFKLWIEEDEKLIFSGWRAELLEAIEETGSLSEAASRLKIHFRSAWGRVHEMEQRLGVKLVETRVGGAGGGGARLTPAGSDLLRRYRQLDADLAAEVERRFAELFPVE